MSDTSTLIAFLETGGKGSGASLDADLPRRDTMLFRALPDIFTQRTFDGAAQETTEFGPPAAAIMPTLVLDIGDGSPQTNSEARVEHLHRQAAEHLD